MHLYYWMRPIQQRPRHERSALERLALQVTKTWFRRTIAYRFGGHIHPATEIGPEASFPHDFHGVFIGTGARIGRGVTIMQNVTIGNSMNARNEDPIIGNNVFIGANACIIGRCVIGDGARIGAGVVLVNVTIPPGAVIVNNSAYDLTNQRLVYGQD